MFFSSEVDEKRNGCYEDKDVDNVREHESSGVHAKKDGILRFVTEIIW